MIECAVSIHGYYQKWNNAYEFLLLPRKDAPTKINGIKGA